MEIEIFELERVQSIWENRVDYNLTESGVHPYTLSELLQPEELGALANLRLGYGQTNGSIPLREAIARLYPGAGSDNVVVTNGSAEANFVAGNAYRALGAELDAREAFGWAARSMAHRSAAHVQLAELALDYACEEVFPRSPGMTSDAFLAVSQRVKVPFFQDGLMNGVRSGRSQ